VIDRCLQARVKNALEPLWEAWFEGSSYGFRPGRGCHDAIQKIYGFARASTRKQWVVDADIKGAFDTIDHAYLLATIGDCPGKGLVKQWLKAGYMEAGVKYDTPAGTPQGSVISPLLANIALHGMETALGVKHNREGHTISPRAVVRYADDFVVFCESRQDAEQVVETLTTWLSQRGLTLSPEKTKIVHLREGFDFLGFNVRHYKTPRSKTGYTLLIKPSNQSVHQVREKLRATWRALHGQNAQAAVKTLNPIIRGWANYFRTQVASRTFTQLDRWMFHKERRYVNRTHPNKSNQWRQQRYWGKLNRKRNDRWVFGDKHTGAYLLKFSWFNIERHVLVKGRASPDDPGLKDYWRRRTAARVKDLRLSHQKIAHTQSHICPFCGESLFNDEELHQDHIEPKAKGGKDVYSNYRLVHLYCHQQHHGVNSRVKK
jgi:RNA-directed DNA polymerase